MIYTINTTLENTTCESITLTLVPEKYYKLPETITVVNGTLVSYDQDTGVAVITGDDTTQISFESIPETYYLFTRVVNGVSTGDTNISYGGTAELHITPEANYELPQDIIVVGADYTYDKVTGVIVLSNAKRDVQINVVCTEYIPQRTQADLTTVDDTVYVPEGQYAQEVSKTVSSGTAGTPVATKGTVTNHSISVTPSVTNTKGYIQGETLTGSPVSVSASELTSGNVNITNTQIVDVTNYSTAQISDANLAAENIKDSVSVLGKTGTFTHIESGGATASDILSGKKAYVNGTEITGNIAAKTSSDITISGNVVTIPAGAYASAATKTVGTSKSAQTYTPTSSDQVIASGQYLTGNQTIEGVVCANLTSENIKDGVTVKIGTSTDDDSVTTVVGSYQGGGGGASIGGAGFTFASSTQTGGSIAGFVLGQVDNGGSYGWHSFSWDGNNTQFLIDGVENYSTFINASLVVFTNVNIRYFDGGEVKLYDGTTINTGAGFSSAVGKICYLTQDTHISWSD